MKITPLFLAFFLLAGCSEEKPFRQGDVLISAKDGTELGTVIEVADHSFENGASGPSVHLQLASGKNAWYSMDTTRETYVVKK
jgi:hypothetical protein